MKCIIRAIEFDLINDVVTLFVRGRLIDVSGDFYRYMNRSLCSSNSGLVRVRPLLVWRFDSSKSFREDGLGKASYIIHILNH